LSLLVEGELLVQLQLEPLKLLVLGTQVIPEFITLKFTCCKLSFKVCGRT
jgi:hypothetical protein